jgi:hypothetical protein
MSGLGKDSGIRPLQNRTMARRQSEAQSIWVIPVKQKQRILRPDVSRKCDLSSFLYICMFEAR